MFRRVIQQSWPVFFLVVFAVFTACSSQAPTVFAKVSDPSLSAGSTIPNPAGDVVLTISGNIGSKNVGDTLAFDMSTLEKIGLVEYSITDPWLNEAEIMYTGLLMTDLLEIAEVPDSATSVHLTALDDYQVEVSIADINKWPVILATRTDGSYMSIENSGPTRIIFPFDAFPEIDETIYKDLSIWSLKSIEIR